MFQQLIAFVFACAGLWFLARGLARLTFWNPEQTWLPVKGIVKQSFVDEDTDGDGDTTYKAKLEYEYEYQGMRFLNDRIAPLQVWSSFRWTAANLTRKYPRGRELIVYVNPQNPGKAVLEPDRQVIAAVCYALAGALLCAMAVLPSLFS